MQYTTISGEIKTLNKKSTKTKKKQKKQSMVGRQMNYVGRTRSTGNRIVCYDGIILSETETHYECKVMDCYIYSNDNTFIINAPKKSIKII